MFGAAQIEDTFDHIMNLFDKFRPYKSVWNLPYIVLFYPQNFDLIKTFETWPYIVLFYPQNFDLIKAFETWPYIVLFYPQNFDLIKAFETYHT